MNVLGTDFSECGTAAQAPFARAPHGRTRGAGGTDSEKFSLQRLYLVHIQRHLVPFRTSGFAARPNAHTHRIFLFFIFYYLVHIPRHWLLRRVARARTRRFFIIIYYLARIRGHWLLRRVTRARTRARCRVQMRHKFSKSSLYKWRYVVNTERWLRLSSKKKMQLAMLEKKKAERLKAELEALKRKVKKRRPSVLRLSSKHSSVCYNIVH